MLQLTDFVSFTRAEFITVVIVDGSEVIKTLGSETLNRTPGGPSNFGFFLGLKPGLDLDSSSKEPSYRRLFETPKSSGTSSDLC